MSLSHGAFVISLDFELYWGVRDKHSISQVSHSMLGCRKAIPEMLRLFTKYNIHATWAPVGFLFFRNSEELHNNIPNTIPDYSLDNLSPYNYIHSSATLAPIYHFAPDLIEMVLKYKGQEIGTHTFSHYYCQEKGQTIFHFEEDIAKAVDIAGEKGVEIKSIVFPRNQWKHDYLKILTKYGIECFRGNEKNIIYKSTRNDKQYNVLRAIRLLDSYINITGYNTYHVSEYIHKKPYNLHASRFLRPYSPKLSIFDTLKLHRITKAMEHAAKNNRVFHIWWHPHNFGLFVEKNILFLQRVLDYYKELHNKYRFTSYNMRELCEMTG